MTDLFRGVREKIDFRPEARKEYEMRVASKDRILDVGGRSRFSTSRKQIELLSRNPNSKVVCTDIVGDYKPDIVDDISNTSIKPNSFDGVYCVAVLEHVQEYWKAVENIHSIIQEGGEAFFYVPFMFHFHDRMDYHRFTFTEVARMLEKFCDVRIFMPGENDGFGWILWYVLTITTIGRHRRLHRKLSKMTDALVKMLISVMYWAKRKEIQKEYDNISLEDLCYYFIYLRMNHGFCAWARK